MGKSLSGGQTGGEGGAKKDKLPFTKKIQKLYRIILRPPKHVLHLSSPMQAKVLFHDVYGTLAVEAVGTISGSIDALVSIVVSRINAGQEGSNRSQPSYIRGISGISVWVSNSF